MEKHLAETATERDNGAEFEKLSERGHFAQDIALLYAARATNAATESFRAVQLAEVSSAGAAISAMSVRLAAGGGTRAGIIRQRQDLLQQWQGFDSALTKAVSNPTAQREAAVEASLRTALAETSKRLDALDTRIADDFPDFAELSNPTPLNAGAAQSLLTTDEALLVYLITNKATWLWVLRRDDFGFYQIEIGAKELASDVKVLRSSLDPMLNPDRRAFQAARAYELYRKLVGPAEPLLAGVRHLLIVPDAALRSLPLGVLVTKAPDHAPETLADHRDIAWLARDYAMTVLPSVSSLRALRQFANSEQASAPFLGVGDPVLNGPPARAPGVTLASLYRGAIADVNKVRALPPLPETADELRAMAKTLSASDSDLLLGKQASETVLRQMPLDRYRVVAFATHGLMSGELKGLAEPALVLTPPVEATAENDGLLTASKIATLKFNADWVVLSACNTAADDGTPDGGGLSGLAKAFFYAGARSLLVSHWPVQSDAAVKLTTSAFAELAKDPAIGRAEALRRSMIAMSDSQNPPEFMHPLYWAPFVLVGEGGAGR